MGASSNTTYNIELVEFAPSDILFNMKNAKIEELLHIVNQPVYAKGNLDIDVNIKNADIANQELKENPKLPITFEGNTTTKLIPNNANTKIILKTQKKKKKKKKKTPPKKKKKKKKKK